jgi:1,2-phenylacetyl-CoA epoxidase catalytic subunit
MITSTQKALLTQMLTSHAYRERLAARRFRQAVKLAPTSQSKEYVMHVAEEEDFHYLGCLKVAEQLQIDLVPLVKRRMLGRPPGIPVFTTWLDVLLAHAFNDKAGYFVLKGIVGSKVPKYARLAAEIIADEETHGLEGAKMLRQFYGRAQMDDRAKRRLLLLHLDAAVRCLGRPNSQRDKEAMKNGLKTISSADTVANFLEYSDRILIQLNCKDLVPVVGRYFGQSTASEA